MTSSMTAFARQQASFPWGMLVWEIRSVNHRYLEPGFRLPEQFRHLEPQLRDLLRQGLSRGKIEAQLKFTPGLDAAAGFNLDQAALGQLNRAMGQVREAVGSTAAPSVLEILKWPGIIQEDSQDSKVIEDEVLALFRAALDKLLAHRNREGGEMAAAVAKRLDAVAGIVDQVRQALPAILEAQHTRLKEQLAELSSELDPARLEQELVILVQKADIHEEIDRLDTHVKETRRVLESNEPIGRRLDFLMQELNREANTICSKAVVTETTLDAVELKVLIEQMREQVQNIE